MTAVAGPGRKNPQRGIEGREQRFVDDDRVRIDAPLWVHWNLVPLW